MSKTPEEMAEEFFENWQPEKPKYIRSKARQYALEKVTDCFLAGYQAAQQWISVKERLPEIPENGYSNRVLLLRADRFIVIARIEKCVRFVRPLQKALIVETDNGDPIEEFTHWMPLPSVEGLKDED